MRLREEDRKGRMMAFGGYADYYDLIYQTKDYRKECAYLKQLFRRYGSGRIRTILDLGCGTGNHMVLLLNAGFTVAGVDASSRMIRIAASKLKTLRLKAGLCRGQLKSFRLKRKFDAAVCLFSVIDYVAREKDILPTLDNIARHLKPNALFVFDFWNEPAVIGHYSRAKRNLYVCGPKSLERRSQTRIDPKRRMCEVKYTCAYRADGERARVDRETHVLRYFSVDEMMTYLELAGFQVLHAHPFLKMDGRIRKNTWDVTMVARKR